LLYLDNLTQKLTTSSKDSSGAVNQVAQKYDEVFVGDSPKPRISVGIGVNWNSPFGPFRIDFAKVLSKVEGDDPKAFTFNVGTQF
jgi:outer membrane protein insertion porin family